MTSPKYSGKPKRPKSPILVRRVSGDSMLPTLPHGQVVWAWRWFGAVRPGDIVLLQHGGLEKIKRVAQVRPGQVYVVGDNAAHSTDSRTLGWLHVSCVQAKLFWPRHSSKTQPNHV